jgi:hypothetical protein
MSEMRRNVLTLWAMISGAVMLLPLSVGSALAFSETPIQQSGQQQTPLTPVTPPSASQSIGGGGSAAKAGAPDLSLADPAASIGESAEGTEVKIPGIGTVGTLPKLDFGLELLYGANGVSPTPEKPAPSNDDMVIRGTLTHRF